MNDVTTESISQQFTEAELSELAACRHVINAAKSFDTLELLIAWAHNVAKIDTDRTAEPLSARAWGGYDLIGSLSLRDFLDKCVDRLDEPLRSKVSSTAEKFDNHFRSITVHDENNLLEKFTDGGLADAPWWWHRIPNSGPILTDLLESK